MTAPSDLAASRREPQHMTASAEQKHPFIAAAEAIEARAADPKNAKYKSAHLETAAHLRAEAVRLPVVDVAAGGVRP